MTREQFKQHWMAMYRVGNRSDTPEGEHEEWTDAAMSGMACCQLLDKMAQELIKCKVWTVEEHQTMLDSL